MWVCSCSDFLSAQFLIKDFQFSPTLLQALSLDVLKNEPVARQVAPSGKQVHFMIAVLINFGLLLAIAAVAVSDCRCRRIPNSATYPLMLTGLSLSLATSGFGFFSMGITEKLSFPGFSDSIKGAFCCFAVMFVIYSYTNSGAGDVKLAAGIGSFLGVQGGILTICYAYIAAACFAGCLIVWMFGFGFAVRSLLRSLRLWPYPEEPAVEDRAKALMSRGLPLAPFFLIGTILALFDLPSFSFSK